MSSPENQDFHVDLSFSAKDTHKTYLIAGITAGAAILFIVLTMITSLATHLLPMEDEYLQVLVPIAADGAEPLGLKSLEHEINENSIVVRGTVQNRTDFDVEAVMAVIEMQDTTGRFAQTVEIPLDPPDLKAQQAGAFMAGAILQQKPAGYVIKFRLADGPFLPHKDERVTLGITVQ